MVTLWERDIINKAQWFLFNCFYWIFMIRRYWIIFLKKTWTWITILNNAFPTCNLSNHIVNTHTSQIYFPILSLKKHNVQQMLRPHLCNCFKMHLRTRHSDLEWGRGTQISDLEKHKWFCPRWCCFLFFEKPRWFFL